MNSHVVVCGFGHIGYRVASLLCGLGEPVTVITLDAKCEWQRALEAAGVRFIIGDAEDAEVLERADLHSARALVACCSVDLINLQIAMEARRLVPDIRIVLRIFDQNLARHAEQSLGVEAALGMAAISAPAFASAALGEDVVASFDIGKTRCAIGRIAAPVESAPATVGSIESKYPLKVLMVTDREGKITFLPRASTQIPEGGTVKAIGVRSALSAALKDDSSNLGIEAIKTASRIAFSPVDVLKFFVRLWKGASSELRGVVIGIFVLMVVFIPVFTSGFGTSALNSFYYIVTTVTTTGYGDFTVKDSPVPVKIAGILLMLLGSFMFAVLYSLITDYFVNARLQQALGRQKVPDGGHIVIAGIGIVGYRIVEELDRNGANLVVVVEQNPNAKFLASVRTRATVVMGDARDVETLEQAGVATARSFIACTGDDAVNLSMGLAASSINPNIRRVLRIFDADFASRIQTSFDGQSALSASRLAAPHFVAHALFGRVVAAFVARDHLFALRPVGSATSSESAEGYLGDVEFPSGEGTTAVSAFARRIGVDIEQAKIKRAKPREPAFGPFGN